MSSSTRWGLTEIPRAIREQEGEIELIYRTLGRVNGRRILDDSPVLPTDFERQEGAAWIFVAMLGSICIVAFYLLWIKAGG
jgi:hypothetical protein